MPSQRPITVATRGWCKGDGNDFSVGGIGSFMISIPPQRQPLWSLPGGYCLRTLILGKAAVIGGSGRGSAGSVRKPPCGTRLATCSTGEGTSGEGAATGVG